MKTYIGVTGFTKREEVEKALDVFPHSSLLKLMVGVLVSWKSLRGIPLEPKRQKRYPDPRLIKDLFFDDERVINLVHYSISKRKEESLVEDMISLRILAGNNLHGFQLNIPWPKIQILKQYRERETTDIIVLQISQKAIEIAGDSIQGVIDRLSPYTEFIDAVLLDPSGGRGQPLDTEQARRLIRAIKDEKWSVFLKVGVAGGLGPDTLHLVEPLISEFPDLNIDAEGCLRDSKFNLDIEKMKTYLKKALLIR